MRKISLNWMTWGWQKLLWHTTSRSTCFDILFFPCGNHSQQQYDCHAVHRSATEPRIVAVTALGGNRNWL